MFEIFESGLGVIFILLLALIVVLICLVLSLMLKVSRINKRYQIMMRGQDGVSLEKAMTNRFKKLDSVSAKSEDMERDMYRIHGKLDRTLTNYGIVKYDAFDDVGGKMSFALAMLDSDNSGFILDTIHSRDNCFVYIKEIVKGESYIMLSNEEIQALKQASSYFEEDELITQAKA